MVARVPFIHSLSASYDAYNPEEEERIPYNDPEISYDWLSGPPIK